jgi:hypothetical protein
MAHARRRKSPQRRLAAYRANFKMTSRIGRYYELGTLPLYAKFFTLDNRNKVINRPGFTDMKILASIDGQPTYKQDPAARRAAANQNVDQQLDREAKNAEQEGDFDPKSVRESRKKMFRTIILRRGQLKFRKRLLAAYGGRCAITDCDCQDALEAAHIFPYAYGGDDTHHVQNGILLRSDVHTLFDIGKIGIEPISHTVIVAGSLKGTVYGKLKGKHLRVTSHPAERPNEEALRQHMDKWELK